MDRRRYLATTGAVAFAGCLHGDDSPETDPPEDDGPNGTAGGSGNESGTDGEQENNQTDATDGDESDDTEPTDGSDAEQDSNDSSDEEADPAEPSFDVELTAPESVDKGEPVTGQLTVSNTGDAAGTFESDISVKQETGIWERADSVEISLDPGTGEVHEITVTPESDSDEVGIRVDAVDVSRVVDILAPAIFEFAIDAPDVADVESSIDMHISATNVGDHPGKPRRWVQRADGDEWEDVSYLEGTIDPGESRSWTAPDTIPKNQWEIKYRIRDYRSWTIAVNFTTEYVREEADAPNIEDYIREFDDWIARPVYFQAGEIYQAIYEYEDGVDYLQMDVSNSDAVRDVAALWYGDERLLEGDSVQVWGVGLQWWTYETAGGSQRTIPMIELVDYE